MNEPRNHLPQDLKALCYLDALNASDLEAVAALWDEASRDPQLERRLAEIDGALFVERTGANGKVDAQRVGGLRPKPVPGAFPTAQASATPRRWAVSAAVVAALAAAILLACRAWPGCDDTNHRPIPATSVSTSPGAVLPSDNSASIRGWREARLILDGAEPPPSAWPLGNTLSMAIPPDLLE